MWTDEMQGNAQGFRSLFLVSAVVLCLCLSSLAQNAKPARSNFPYVFNPEIEDKGFEQAQPPSDLVLNALLDTEEARGYAPELQGRSHEELLGLFRVVEVRLGPADEQDYLAQGKPPLTGADCNWFWIVRVRGGQARVVLFVNALSVTILKARTNGYSDIRSDWGTARFSGTDIFKYNGKIYKRSSARTWENKP